MKKKNKDPKAAHHGLQKILMFFERSEKFQRHQQWKSETGSNGQTDKGKC